MSIIYKKVSSVTGVGGLTSIPVNSLFVDAVNGNDGTAVPYDMSKPYATVEGAVAALTSGDTIWVRAGTYVAVATSGTTRLAPTVPFNMHICNGVIFDVTTNQATVDYMMISTGAGDHNITGYLRTTIPTADMGGFWLGATGSESMYVEAIEINTFSNSGTAAVRSDATGDLIVKADINTGGTNAYGVQGRKSRIVQEGTIVSDGGTCIIDETLNANDHIIKGDLINNSATLGTFTFTGNGTATVTGKLENLGTEGAVLSTGAGDLITKGSTLISAGTNSLTAAGPGGNLYAYNAMLNKGVGTMVVIVPSYTIDSNVI